VGGTSSNAIPQVAFGVLPKCRLFCSDFLGRFFRVALPLPLRRGAVELGQRVGLDVHGAEYRIGGAEQRESFSARLSNDTSQVLPDMPATDWSSKGSSGPAAN
jgi:hypothetical protein